MFFKTFENAIYCLNFPRNTCCIYIVQCKRSYEYFERNDSVLVCIGQGPKSSPGHPSGNQYDSNQLLLHGPPSLQGLYPVFRIFSDSVEYVGNYRLIGWRKRISFEGFAYYEYKFTRSTYTRIAQLPPDDIIVEVTNTVEKVTDNPTIIDSPVKATFDDKAVEEVTPKTYWFPRCSS